jgi:hypothetical protein
MEVTMKRYRIYTEHKANLDKIVSKWFDNYTRYIGHGVYKGDKELSAVIEIICEDKPTYSINVKMLCTEIKRQNKQECVLLTVEDVRSITI